MKVSLLSAANGGWRRTPLIDFDANVRLKGEVQLSCFDSRIMQMSLNYIFQEMKGNLFFSMFSFFFKFLEQQA